MTWNTAVPAGTDLVSQGDDVIREFKTDVQTSLVATEGAPLSQDAGAFPGADINNPKYHYRGLKGSTADRPAATHYGLYFNTTTNTLQRSNGTTWEDVTTNGVTPGSFTDNAIIRADGVDGGIQDSGIIIDDANNVTGVNDLEVLDDIDIGGSVVIAGTTGHSVTSEFANECWEEVTRANGGTVAGIRELARDSEVTDSDSSGNWVAVSGVQVTITTTGKPVYVTLGGTTTSLGGATIGMNASTLQTMTSAFRFVRDGSAFSTVQLNAYGVVYTIPASSFNVIDPVAAGTYVYTLEFRDLSAIGTHAVNVNDIRLYAYELG